MRLYITTLLAVLCISASSQNSLDIMYYNLLNFPGTTPGRADTLRKVVQYSKPDILVVNELISEVGADLILNNSLNKWGINYYKRAIFTNGYDTDNMLFYDSTKVALYDQFEIVTELRLINEYTLYPLPIRNDTVFFTVYSAHLKASPGSQEENLRYEEVLAFKEHLSKKNHHTNIIFGGDLNIYTSSEKAYEAIISAYEIPLYDPIFKPGSWHNNSYYSDIHTQSTRKSQFGGGASGGMDDRFDMIFVSSEIISGANRMKYKDESYFALGQDGNRFNESLINPPNYSAPDSVISALYYMSDHLPVIMTLDILDEPSAISQEKKNNWKVDFSIHRYSIQILNLQETTQLNIIDLNGHEIYRKELSQGSHSVQLPVNLMNGMYLFQFKEINSKNSFTKKVILAID